jgi:predicted PhzF superfamily epimerase YddE/YHI9
MSTAGIPYAIVDVFATGPFTGNQAAVVITPERLGQETMQNIAT